MGYARTGLANKCKSRVGRGANRDAIYTMLVQTFGNDSIGALGRVDLKVT